MCRLKVIRGRWFTYILRDLVVHFLRIYIVVVVGTCVICPAAPPLSLGFCVFLSHRLDRSICCVVSLDPGVSTGSAVVTASVSFFGTCSFFEVLYCVRKVFVFVLCRVEYSGQLVASAEEVDNQITQNVSEPTTPNK